MITRKVQIEDLPQLSEKFNAYRGFYRKKPNVEGAKTFLHERITTNDSEIFICESTDGQLAGFVQLYPLFSSTRMKKFWLLNDLFVDPLFRGKGVSLKLIEKAKELIIKTKACGMFLETEKSNTIGNSLYPRAGFELNDGSNFYEWNYNPEQ